MTGFEEVDTDAGKIYQISLIGPWFTMGSLELNDGGRIIKVDEGVLEISGFTKKPYLAAVFISRLYKIGSENPVNRPSPRTGVRNLPSRLKRALMRR